MRSSVDSDMTRKRQPALHTASSSSMSAIGTSAMSQRRRPLVGRTWFELGFGLEAEHSRLEFGFGLGLGLRFRVRVPDSGSDSGSGSGSGSGLGAPPYTRQACIA